MQKEIYLDNAASTPNDKMVVESMLDFWTVAFGNPSSFNDSGRVARDAIEKSRKITARFLGAKDQEIIFTGSGTESNNLAVLGLIKSIQGLPTTNHPLSTSNKRKPHIITTKIEHPSVLRPIQYLGKTGQVGVTYLPVDKSGLIELSDFKKSLRPETVLVSIIYVNNEIGVVQPVKKIGKIIKEYQKSLEIRNRKLEIHGKTPFFHVDACQATGYFDVNVNNLGIDLMTLNGSKIHGPKGIGVLYIKRGTPMQPIIFGGGQEKGLRSGTESVPAIVGFGKAVEIIQSSSLQSEKLKALKIFLVEKLLKSLPEVRVNGDLNTSSPHIISLTIPGIEAEVVLLMLDKYGIRASAGAACSNRDIETSHVLRAIGLSNNDARATLRFSLGRQNTKQEIGLAVRALSKVIQSFHKVYPKSLKKQYYVKYQNV